MKCRRWARVIARSLILCLLGSVCMLISGCYEPILSLDFNEQGVSPLTITVIGGDMVSEEDMNVVFSQLTMLIPELLKNYDCRVEGKQIVLIRRNFALAQDFPYITFKKQADGSYLFEAAIPALYATEQESDDVFMTLRVSLPRAIDMANTIDVSDRAATWTVRKNQLHKAQRLRAVTVAD